MNNQSLKILKKFGYNTAKIEKENWNAEYEAMSFHDTKYQYKSRLAKKTPKKQGYFVAIWEKDIFSKNVPFNEKSPFDFILINVIDGQNIGQFAFPKKILISKGIISTENKLGKMAFRVYPSWIQPLNKTAEQTQKWQLNYFKTYHHNKIHDE